MGIFQSRDKEQNTHSKWAKKKKIQHIYGANIVAEESHDDAGIQG